MAESANPGGPSLEQILWRAMDRFAEEPALLDAEEFAGHIEHAFDGRVPALDFVEHFFAGPDRMHEPAEAADASVRATGRRLHAYEFDLHRLEYVIVEDKDRLVVVSDFGQFAVQSSDAVGRALEAAVVRKQERSGAEPRAYFVRQGGEVVGLDVSKVSRTLEHLFVRQVSLPAVDAPARRLASLNPVRTSLTPARELRAIRQQAPRSPARVAVPAPRREAARGGATPAVAARPALVLLMPDGSLARAEIGAATRWRQMIGRAAAAEVAERTTVQTRSVVAVIRGTAKLPGGVGERALLRADALTAVRTDAAPVRALGDDALARAFTSGARLVPAIAHREQFWVQPEKAFRPELPAPAPVVAQPLRLGEITGDPWADWALTGGAESVPQVALALRGRARPPLRSGPDGAAAEPLIPPALAERLRNLPARELHFNGAPVIAFRAPDGAVIMNRASGVVRLASPDRDDARPIEELLPLEPLVRGEEVAPRSGAVPFTALQTLQLALERTASAGGYRLPLLRLDSARDAIETGSAMQELDAADERRKAARLAAPPTLWGSTAQLVLSMPFPNQGELHVGSDLSDALHAYLAAPVVPAAPPQQRFVFTVPQPGLEAPASTIDVSSLHAQATGKARDAAVAFDFAAVRGPAAVSGLPVLLRRALAQSGDWTPGPGAPPPMAIRDFTLSAPFTMAAAPEQSPVPPRPLRPGEDEIVIPMPLWAQMGRGAVSETEQVMASPLAPRGYAPPLGVYRLVVSAGGPLDLAGGAPAGTPRVVDLSGPATITVTSRPGAVTASTGAGRQFLARVPLADRETVVGRRGRIRIGEPLRDIRFPAAPLPVLPSPDDFAEAPADAGAFRAVDAGVRAVVAPEPLAVPARPTLVPESIGGAPAPSAETPRFADVSRPLAKRSGAVRRARGAAVSPGLSAPGFDAALVSGLAPGMWSGHKRSDTAGYQPWAYSFRFADEPQAEGGIRLSSLSRPVYPQLPPSLRFRYAGAPLWWSRPSQIVADDADLSQQRSMGDALRAANSAASIWRSILVAVPAGDDLTGGMDAERDVGAGRMSSIRSFDAIASAPLVAAPAAPAPGPAYIAMTSGGAAGAVSPASAARARAEAVEMSIVAAIPPAPPPLESMGSGVAAAEAPRARGKGPAESQRGAHKDADDPVSASKIEGSVDAIAQRIYHRIRRRIQSDRERFGG